MERGRDRADVAIAPRRNLARQQALHRQGRPVHLGHADRQVEPATSRQSALVPRNVRVAVASSVTDPLLQDVPNHRRDAICELAPIGVHRSLIANRDKPPFDNPDLRRAMALSFDRKAFIAIVTEGQGDIGGVMQPPPEGLWGMPPEILKTLPGYDPDVQKNRTDGRQIMEKLGYGP